MSKINSKPSAKPIAYTGDPLAKNQLKPTLGVLKSTPPKDTFKPNAGGRK